MMATSIDFINYVCDEIKGVGLVTYKKMFGEYMIYVNEKPVLTVCDGVVYVKKVDYLESLMKDAEVGFPYKGAKEHYILDIDDSDFSKCVVSLLEKNTLVPKKKIKK